MFTSIVIFVFCLFFSALFFDVSFDGQGYHQEATILLAEGWEPLSESPYGIEEVVFPNSRVTRVITHFPKYTWTVEAVLYQLTNYIEYGKGLGLILCLCAAGLCFSLLRKHFKTSRFCAILLSLLAVCSPIVVCQIFSYYVDGVLASLLVSILCLFTFVSLRAPHARLTLVLTIIAFCNVKFTALAYAVIFIIAALIWALIYERNRLRELAFLGMSSLVLAIAVFGYQPYVRNILEQGSIFYPFKGSQISGNSSLEKNASVLNLPRAYVPENRFRKLFYSLFSVSGNEHLKNEEPELKLPWQVSKKEVQLFSIPDARIAGFGPLFALALCISVLGVPLLFFQMDRLARNALFLIAVLFFSVIANPEAWWARYVPQLWLIPLIIYAVVFIGSNAMIIRAFASVLLLVMSANLALVSYGYFPMQWRMTAAVREQIQALRGGTYEVHFDDFRGNQARFRENGIVYREVGEILCENPIPILFSQTRLCPVEN